MPDEISDEDRERLVEAKFSELFNRNFERVFGESFDKRVAEMAAANSKSKRGDAAQQGTGNAPAPEVRKRQRYSLLDKALGIG